MFRIGACHIGGGGGAVCTILRGRGRRYVPYWRGVCGAVCTMLGGGGGGSVRFIPCLWIGMTLFGAWHALCWTNVITLYCRAQAKRTNSQFGNC